LFGEDLT